MELENNVFWTSSIKFIHAPKEELLLLMLKQNLNIKIWQNISERRLEESKCSLTLHEALFPEIWSSPLLLKAIHISGCSDFVYNMQQKVQLKGVSERTSKVVCLCVSCIRSEICCAWEKLLKNLWADYYCFLPSC